MEKRAALAILAEFTAAALTAALPIRTQAGYPPDRFVKVTPVTSLPNSMNARRTANFFAAMARWQSRHRDGELYDVKLTAGLFQAGVQCSIMLSGVWPRFFATACNILKLPRMVKTEED